MPARDGGGLVSGFPCMALAMVMSVASTASAQGPGDRNGESEQRLIEKLGLQTLLNTPVDVWTPSKRPQPSYQAPSIITTVTREQIAIWGYRTVAELLEHLLGFYVIDDHTTTNVLVRGNSGGLYSDSSILKVLLDGNPIAFNWSGGIGLGPEL